MYTFGWLKPILIDFRRLKPISTPLPWLKLVFTGQNYNHDANRINFMYKIISDYFTATQRTQEKALHWLQKFFIIHEEWIRKPFYWISNFKRYNIIHYKHTVLYSSIEDIYTGIQNFKKIHRSTMQSKQKKIKMFFKRKFNFPTYV